MGNQRLRVRNYVKKKIHQRNTSNLQHAMAARRENNVAAALNNDNDNISSNNDNISLNSVNSVNSVNSENSSISELVIDNGNRDHPPLGRRTTNTKTLLDEAESITLNLPNKRIRKSVLNFDPSVPIPVARGLPQNFPDIPIVDDSLDQISELDRIIISMNKDTYVNVGGKHILFDMSTKY